MFLSIPWPVEFEIFKRSPYLAYYSVLTLKGFRDLRSSFNISRAAFLNMGSIATIAPDMIEETVDLLASRSTYYMDSLQYQIRT